MHRGTWLRLAVGVAVVSLFLFSAKAKAADVQQSDVFVAGQEGYHTFRIPAVIVTPDKTVIAFCEGRKNNRRDHGDIDLVMKRSTDGGRSWSPLEVIYEEGGNAEVTIGNPCPVIDQTTGTIWLPFCRDNDDVLLTHSTDDGQTWAPPVEITADVKRNDWGWYATGPGVGIQLTHPRYAGRLVIPCDHREEVDGQSVKMSHCFYSDDGGRSWQMGQSVDKHTDECQVVELADGRLMINMRNYWGRTGKVAERAGMRAIAYSEDGGQHWSDVEFDPTLIEPVCQASFLRYTEGDEHEKNRLLFANPASKTRRHELTIRLSYDEGRTWPVARVLHPGPAAYCCLTVMPDQTIGCLYENGKEHSYEKITLARFTLEWLTDGADAINATK